MEEEIREGGRNEGGDRNTAEWKGDREGVEQEREGGGKERMKERIKEGREGERRVVKGSDKKWVLVRVQAKIKLVVSRILYFYS